MVSADCSTKGSCISPVGEELSHRLHAGQEEVVDDGERGVPGGQGLGQVVLEAVAVAVDDALLEATLDGPPRAVLGHRRRGRDAFEDPQQFLEGVIALGAPVVDEVEADFTGVLVDLRQGDDARRMDDGGVEAGFDELVEEHGVEDVARRGVEPERHVGQPHNGEHSGQLALDAAGALEGLDAVTPALLHACRQGQHQRVEDEVRGLEAVAVDGDVANGRGGAHLPVGGAGLALGQLMRYAADHGAHGGQSLALYDLLLKFTFDGNVADRNDDSGDLALAIGQLACSGPHRARVSIPMPRTVFG